MTQDLDHPNFGDITVIEPFLEQVRKAEGVAHFLFHQVHIHRQEAVREAFRQLIQTAKQQGFAGNAPVEERFGVTCIKAVLA